MDDNRTLFQRWKRPNIERQWGTLIKTTAQKLNAQVMLTSRKQTHMHKLNKTHAH